MNIYMHELKMNMRSVITWSVSASLMILVFTSIFSALAVDAALLNETMQQFPEELLIAFGMNGLDLSTIMGYFSFVFLFCQILLAVQAANYGFSILSIEERELTADFLLTRPVSRKRILLSKVLASFTGLTITNLVVWLSSFLFLNLFKGDREFDAGPLLLLLLSIVVFQLVFLSIGMLVTVLVKRVRSVTPYSMALAFGMYVLSAFSGMLGEVKLEFITPFKHFEPRYIVSHSAYDPAALISLAYIAISAVGVYVLYQKRDIPSPV